MYGGSLATPSNPGSPPQPRTLTKQSPEYGQGSHDVEGADYEHADANELRDKLLGIFRSPAYRPPVLPSVAIELTELTRKVDASFEDVILVLQKDPLIVAGVLKVAQSPLYGGRLPVQSLKEAIQRLGINTLRDIVWQVASGMRLFRVKSYASLMEQLQAHSMFTAYMARMVAQRAGIAAEHAFLCGLLHDVGISGTLIALAESDKTPPRLSTLWEAIDGMHETAGGAMAKLWGLSPEIVTVIQHHHQVDMKGKQISSLIPVLCVAEHLADEVGLGLMREPGPAAPIDRFLPGRYEHALSTLRLAQKQVELRKYAQDIADRM